jgi:hypothetical protein
MSEHRTGECQSQFLAWATVVESPSDRLDLLKWRHQMAQPTLHLVCGVCREV